MQGETPHVSKGGSQTIRIDFQGRKGMELTRNRTATIVVVNYNGKKYLEDCLSSVGKAVGPIEEVILVDDASTDGGVAFVKEKFPWVRILELPENSGPAAARNAGIAAAGTDWVCLLDNDVLVDCRWLTRLLNAALEKPDAALYTSLILRYEEPDMIGAEVMDIHFLGMPTFRNAGKKVSELSDFSTKETGAAGGISILIDKKTVGDEPFEADFFYGFEDTDFCLRFRSKGLKCFVVPKSVVYHKFGTGGTDDLSDRYDSYSRRRAFFIFRNRWRLIYRYYGTRTIFVLAPALFLFELATVLFALRRGVFRSYIKAVVSFFKINANCPGIRGKIQRQRLQGDAELLAGPSLSPGKGTVRSKAESAVVGLMNRFFELYWIMAKPFIRK